MTGAVSVARRVYERPSKQRCERRGVLETDDGLLDDIAVTCCAVGGNGMKYESRQRVKQLQDTATVAGAQQKSSRVGSYESSADVCVKLCLWQRCVWCATPSFPNER